MATTELTHPASEPKPNTEDILLPVVLDLGKTKKKLVKALKQGEGPLIDDVFDAVDAVRQNMGGELDGKILVPVVIVYEKKSRRKGLLSLG
ncbi:MAG: hypothetical protein ABIQ44_04430 [Chloroflexia bacterium]